MSDSEYLEEEIDQLEELLEKKRKQNTTFPLVSGWEKDTDGIEEEKHPHESPTKEILWAAENGDLDLVKKLVNLDNALINSIDKDDYTPLHRACYNNHFEIVKFLLSRGANYSAKTIDNWQPLHSACKWNSYESAVLLLSNGADINALSKGGVTPLHLAAGHSEGRKLIQFLLSNPELVLNAKDTTGDTPLDIAVRTSRNGPLFEVCEPCFFL